MTRALHLAQTDALCAGRASLIGPAAACAVRSLVALPAALNGAAHSTVPNYNSFEREAASASCHEIPAAAGFRFLAFYLLLSVE